MPWARGDVPIVSGPHRMDGSVRRCHALVTMTVQQSPRERPAARQIRVRRSLERPLQIRERTLHAIRKRKLPLMVGLRSRAFLVSILAFVWAGTAGAQSGGLLWPTPLVAVTPSISDAFRSLVTADFDHDGYVDAVVGGSASQVYYCAGTPGGFAPAVASVAEASFPGYVITVMAARDLNADGLLDLVVSVWPAYVKALLNVGGGAFVVGGADASGVVHQNVAGIAVADLDGDGGTDVIVAGRTTTAANVPTLVVLEPTGLGSTIVTTFTAPLSEPDPALCVGDFNNDGLKDVAWTDSLVPQLHVMYRIAGGGFTAPGPVPLPVGTLGSFSASEAFARDLNADGIDDVFLVGLTSFATGGITTEMATAFGSFAGLGGATSYASNQVPWGFAVRGLLEDFDLDGSFEFTRTTGIYRTTSVSASLGATYFAIGAPSGGVSIQGLAPWDVDADGDVDIIVAAASLQLPASFTLYLGVTRNEAVYAAGCGGSNGDMGFTVGPCILGNPACALTVTNALPGASAVLGLTLGAGVLTSGCTLWLDVNPSQIILPSGPLGFVTVGAAGTAQIVLSIPVIPQLFGQDFFAQWVVADPAGSFQLGGGTYALSPARRLYIW